tara:strand:+ start:1119 stop:1457 length:339 start_codon:yes stop_codon:yes gene_type:complete
MEPIVFDEEELDVIAEYDEETLEQFEDERCLNIIDEFKDEIIKEPEFYAINNISSYEIYNLTKLDHKFTKNILTEEQLILFDKMFLSIYYYSTTTSNYNFIAYNIFKRIYII